MGAVRAKRWVCTGLDLIVTGAVYIVSMRTGVVSYRNFQAWRRPLLESNKNL